MKNEDIIFASLVGSKLFKTSQNLIIFQNEHAKKDSNKSVFSQFGNINRSDPKLTHDQQFFPLGFQFYENGLIWWLPYEPLISIKGSNTIERQHVSKTQVINKNRDVEVWKKTNLITNGTLKNMRPNDYEITITGVLIGENERGTAADCYPRHDFIKLIQYLTDRDNIRVYSPVLELLNISYIVIEDFSFPFTKGENTQAYEIKALSDSGKYNLE